MGVVTHHLPIPFKLDYINCPRVANLHKDTYLEPYYIFCGCLLLFVVVTDVLLFAFCVHIYCGNELKFAAN